MPDLGPSSKYQQLADDLQRRIDTGQFAVGDRLPSIRQMASDAGVSLVTMMRAVQVVAKRGLVNSRPGDGTIVTSRSQPEEMPLAAGTGTVGFVLAHHEGLGHPNPELLGNIQNHLREHGKRVEFEQIGYPFDHADIERFTTMGWQGVILTGAVRDHHIRALRAAGIPFVLAGTYNLTEPCTQARIDMETSIAGVFRKLFDHGMSRVGVIVGRQDFYANHLAASLLENESRLADIPFDSSQVVFDASDGADPDVVTQLLDAMGRPDALWTTGNLINAVLRGLRDQRLQPGRNITLAGMRNPTDRQDVPFSYELLFPGQWAASICEALLNLLKRGHTAEPCTYSIPMPLIERTMAPKRRRPAPHAAAVT